MDVDMAGRGSYMATSCGGVVPDLYQTTSCDGVVPDFSFPVLSTSFRERLGCSIANDMSVDMTGRESYMIRYTVLPDLLFRFDRQQLEP